MGRRSASAFSAFASAAAAEHGLSARAAAAEVASRWCEQGKVSAVQVGTGASSSSGSPSVSRHQPDRGLSKLVEHENGEGGRQKEYLRLVDDATPVALNTNGGRAAVASADGRIVNSSHEAETEAEDVRRWRGVVGELCAAAAAGGIEEEVISNSSCESEDLQDLDELEDLLVKGDNYGPRCEFTRLGERPVLVTAPHGMYLLRDGWEPHLQEEYTTEVARALAEELCGACLSWSLSEQRCSELLVSLGRRQGRDIAELLDPRIRDPNYLRAQELESNSWFNMMQAAAIGWRKTGKYVSLLHIDVHGCKTPPATKSHMTVGLGAMQAHAESCGASAIVAAFSAALETELNAVLEGLKLRPKATLVLVVDRDMRDGAPARFSGAWTPESGRLTQTQQAMRFAGFSHSMQLEMSKVLRRQLLKDSIAMLRFCNAIRTAWARSKCTS